MSKFTQLIPCSLEDKYCNLLGYIVPILWIDWSLINLEDRRQSQYFMPKLWYMSGIM